jgi:hypothetical protein
MKYSKIYARYLGYGIAILQIPIRENTRRCSDVFFSETLTISKDL